jgi:predicted small lipoprotein YifL
VNRFSLFTLISLYLLTLNFLTSCGQKGDLVRPVPVTTTPAAPVPPEQPQPQKKQ